MAQSIQSTLEGGQEARIVQINFSAALDRVNHQEILVKLCSVSVGVSVMHVLAQFSLIGHSIRMTRWMVVEANWLTWCQECPMQ